jgi:hypothetical protein
MVRTLRNTMADYHDLVGSGWREIYRNRELTPR